MQKLAEDGKTYVDETVNTVVATITARTARSPVPEPQCRD